VLSIGQAVGRTVRYKDGRNKTLFYVTVVSHTYDSPITTWDKQSKGILTFLHSIIF